MGVFGKKGKAKDDSYEIPPANGEILSTKMSKSLKRKQKNNPEPAPQLDLTTALPDTNDFRTSLLMPGLSARFSMLREQDDPNTKVGKASDDSVLFPKRASRLNLFAHNPLTDISETESIKTAFRPPFAEADRSHSFSEGGFAGDDTSSILSRSRPVEGNNLFGGRQKMFKVPAASASTPNVVESGPQFATSKHLYEKDVIMSPYQQYRAKKEEERLREESRERPVSNDTDEHEYGSVVNTPSTGFSKSRGTASSTASAPSNRRTSTAATSVISDAPYPRQSNLSSSPNARTNASEFGSADSLINRKAYPITESEHQPPVPKYPEANRGTPILRSGTDASDKFPRSPGGLRTHSPRTISPPPLQTHALASLDFGLKTSNGTSRRYQTASPTSDPEEDIYSQSLQPNDRGKATAMGLFNRPRQQFDEQKFQERQLQMHGGGMSPPSTDMSRGRDILQRREPSAPPSPDSRPSASGLSNSTLTGTRPRGQSNASSTNAAQVQARVEALIKRQNEEYTTLQSTVAAKSTVHTLSPPKGLQNQPAASRGTFFDTFDGSDDDEDAESPMLGRYEEQPRISPMEVHPALRSPSQPLDFGEHPASRVSRPKSSTSQATSSPSMLQDTPDTSDSLHRDSHGKSNDSPTLGPTTGLGLSGLIRTHLRHDSDRSSLLPPSPGIQGMPSVYREQGAFRERETSIASTARTINPPESTHSDPWEFEHRVQRSPLEPQPNDVIPTMSQKAQQILGQANFHRNQAANKVQQVLGNDAPNNDEDRGAMRPWVSDVIQGHHRGESTDTQKEFADELAERAKRIQEGLKSNGPVGPRSRSPSRTDRSNSATQAFQALRHKTSKTSIGPRNNETQPNPKAMKMLGLADGARSEGLDRPSPVGGRPEHMERSPYMGPPPGQMDRPPHMGSRPEHMDRPRYQGGRPDHIQQSPYMGGRVENEFGQGYPDHSNRPTPRQRPAEFGPPRPGPGYGRPPPPNSSDEDFEYSRNRAATPTQGRQPYRERAGSEAAERSRSRAGRHREDQPYGPPVDYDRQRPSRSPPQMEYRERRPGPPPVRRPGPPPVEYERSASAMSNRRPSANGPRPEPSAYFDSRSTTPTITGTPTLGPGPGGMAAPRPSPRPPFPHSPVASFHPNGSSPALSGLPSPLPPQDPYASGRSTPVERAPPSARKKSVTKGMISEPTFISSTSSVPLVGLPNGPRPANGTPPVPAMNPRRRGNTMSERPVQDYPSPRLPAPAPESPRHGAPPMAPQAYPDSQGKRPRNRLRKISSEGGNMAARARQQALMAEFGHEKLRSPAVPVFPNRSATSLGVHMQEGGMF